MLRSLSLAIGATAVFAASQSLRPLPQAQFARLDETLHIPGTDSRVEGALLGDVDGIGPLDLLRWGPDGIEYLRGLGNSRFDVGRVLAVEPVDNAVLADVDGDGDRDIALIARGGQANQLRLLRNRAGTFSIDATAVSGTNVRDGAPLVVGDVDGDGDDDIATVDSDTPAILSMDASGALRPSPVTGFPRANPLALTDVDGDGDLDWVQLHRPNMGRLIEVLHNDGLGRFTSGFVSPVLPGARLATGWFAVDLDRTGAIDLAVATQQFVAGPTRHGLALFTADGSGGYGTPVFLDGLVEPPRNVSVDDIDGDGRNEFVVSGGLTAGVRIYEALSSSLLDVTASHLAEPDAILQSSLEDLDGDGDIDLLAVRGGRELAAFLNDGTGRLQPILRNLRAALPDVRDAARVDVDGDGFEDLVTGSGDVLMAARPAGLEIETGRFPAVALARPNVADLDGDGRPDLFFAQDNPAAYLAPSWLAVPHLPQPGSRIRGLAADDFDGDGVGDLALITSGELELWVGDGRGGYATRRTPMPLGGSVLPQVFAEDLDGDGDRDLIGAGSWGPFALLNDGSGAFTNVSTTVFPGPHWPSAGLIAVDLDRDGVREFVVSPVLQSDVEVWSHAGGAYRRRTVHVGTLTVGALRAADVDLDGDADLIVARSPSIALLVNDGSGTLTLANAARAAAIPGPWFELLDIDGDGDADLVAGAVYHNTHRQLRVPYHPTLGGTLEVDLWAAPTYGAPVVAATLVSPEVLATPLRLVAGSALFANPNSGSLLPWVSVPGTATQGLAIPSHPALAGQSFVVQSLYLEPAALRLGNPGFGFVLR